MRSLAVTKIWTIHEGSDIKQVLDYAANEKKTIVNIHVETDENYNQIDRQQFQDVIDYTMQGYRDAYDTDDMGNVIDYAARGEKTEERKYVTGINCSPEYARDQMMLTKTHYHKKSGILLWHGYQSFKPGEVTPEEAHAIGVELAQRLWDDDYEILVCTHLDTLHIHNHFVINSVSWRNGKKLDVRWKDMARESDRLCRQYEKSIVENPQIKGKAYAEYQAEKEGRPTWTTAIRQDIDECIAESRNLQEFLKNLKSRGYTIKAGAKYFTLKPPGKERFVRIDRRLGDRYSLSGIDARIEESVKSGRYRMPEETKTRTLYASRPRYKITGIHALYVRYCFLLGVYQGKHMTAKQVNYLYREDLTKLHRIRSETQFLSKYKIDNLQELADAEYDIKQDLKRYQDEKTYIINRLRSASGADKDTLEEKKNYLSGKIKDCRRKLYWCKDIKENSRKMQEKVEKVREMERGNMEHGREEERKL